MKTFYSSLLLRALCALLVLLLQLRFAVAQDTPVSAAPTQDVLRAYLKVQEQLHTMQDKLEDNRRDAEDIAARNVKALGERLNALEQNVGDQRIAELAAMQKSNRLIIFTLAAVALVGIIIVAFTYLQWRAMHQFTAVALNLQAQLQLGAGRSTSFVDASEPRLLAVIDRLEKRINELENLNHLTLPPTGDATITPLVGAPANGSGNAAGTLLARAQDLVSQGKLLDAVKLFDELLQHDPMNTDALIKKGSVLEKMQKLDDAVACYDRAIEADHNVTLAYLYKGGVFNRQEKYNEALACYEQALKTQEKAHAA
jgi:tetratricopeptide (TPR) repeat protein